MKFRYLLPPAVIAALFALTSFASPAPSSAEGCTTGACLFLGSVATSPTPTPPPAPATCVVSGDKLGHMGKPFEYLFQQPGKPDRVITFCCEDCVKDFEKNPAKYLAQLDASATATKAAGK